MLAGPGTVLTALYVELTDRIMPSRGFTRSAGQAAGGNRRRTGLPGRRAGAAALQRRAALAARRPGPGRAPVSPAAAPKRVQPAAQGRGAADGGRAAVAGRSHPRQRGDGEADGRHAHPVRALGHHRPRSACSDGQATGTAQPFPLVLGAKLLLLVTCDGTVTGFCLANPELAGEQDQARQMLQATRQPPGAGHRHRHRQGPVRRRHRRFFAGPDLGLTLIRPARKDEKQPRYFPNWLRQRVEAIIWT